MVNKEKLGKKAGAFLLAAALCLTTACGGSSTETANQAEDSVVTETSQAEAGIENIDGEAAAMEGERPEGMPEGMEQGGFYMGEILSIEDMTITVSVKGGGRNGGGKMPEGGMPQEGTEMTQPAEMAEGELPEGTAPGEAGSVTERPQGGRPDGEAPQGEKPSGELPEGMEPGELPEGMEPGERPEGMGEAQSMVIEVTEDTVITIEGTEAAITDLKEGDTIQFTMEEDAVISITVGELQMPEKAE